MKQAKAWAVFMQEDLTKALRSCMRQVFRATLTRRAIKLLAQISDPSDNPAVTEGLTVV